MHHMHESKLIDNHIQMAMSNDKDTTLRESLKRGVVRHFLQRGETEFKTTQQYHQEIKRILRSEGSSVSIGLSTLKKWSLAYRYDINPIDDGTITTAINTVHSKVRKWI